MNTPEGPCIRCKHVVSVSDLHIGSTLGLCPPSVDLDDGGVYEPSAQQKVLWGWWTYFWKEWIPSVTRKEPYVLVVNGDVIDGVHHGVTGLFSISLEDQERCAVSVLRPIVQSSACRAVFLVRGTEAHAGKGCQSEERIAAARGAIACGSIHSRWSLWLSLNGLPIHFAHHVGTSKRLHTEASALAGELASVFLNAGRWGESAPALCVRSHRHQYSQFHVQSASGTAKIVVTPGWQLATPFIHKINPTSIPQIGGICISLEDDNLIVREKLWVPQRPEAVQLETTGPRLPRTSAKLRKKKR